MSNQNFKKLLSCTMLHTIAQLKFLHSSLWLLQWTSFTTSCLNAMIDCNFAIVAGQGFWRLFCHYMDWLWSGVVSKEEEGGERWGNGVEVEAILMHWLQIQHCVCNITKGKDTTKHATYFKNNIIEWKDIIKHKKT